MFPSLCFLYPTSLWEWALMKSLHICIFSKHTFCSSASSIHDNILLGGFFLVWITICASTFWSSSVCSYDVWMIRKCLLCTSLYMIRSVSTFSRVGNANWPFYVEGTVYNVRPTATCPLAYSHLPTFYCLLKIPTTSYWACLAWVNLSVGQIWFLHTVAKL